MTPQRRAAGLWAVLITTPVLLIGCAGSRGAVTADGARYPVSFSPTLPDDQGRVLYLNEELEGKGEVSVETTKIGFFYSAAGLDLDISEDINREVEANGGIGVVALRVTTSQCALNWFFPLTVLPFWPGCQSYQVSGVVVGRKAATKGGSNAGEASP